MFVAKTVFGTSDGFGPLSTPGEAFIAAGHTAPDTAPEGTMANGVSESSADESDSAEDEEVIILR